MMEDWRIYNSKKKKTQYKLTKYIEYKRPAIVDWNGTDKAREGEGKDVTNHHTCKWSCQNDKCSYIHVCIHVHVYTLLIINNLLRTVHSGCDVTSVDIHLS